MALTNEINELKQIQCDDKCIFTLYLNTDPANPDKQTGEWKIELKNGLKRITEYLDASGDKDQKKAFKTISEKVNKEIEENRTSLQKSVVIFASEEIDLWSVHFLQIPVETSFHWESYPVLDQLRELEETHPRSAIVLPNMDEVRILDTALGEVHSELVYTFDSGKEEWSLHEGLGSADRKASGATHVDKFQTRFKENMSRFYRDLATKVEKMKKKYGWHDIHIVGESDQANTFKKAMQKEPDSVTYKNLNEAKNDKILNEVFSK